MVLFFEYLPENNNTQNLKLSVMKKNEIISGILAAAVVVVYVVCLVVIL